MPLYFVRNDLVCMETDAIVNAANTSLAPGGGVCGAIFQAAGYARLDAACRALGHCAVGDAVVTPGFALKARYVIHTVGPIWQGGGQHEAQLLQSCYRRSLELAVQQGCASVAFPLISAGIYGYPKADALRIAVQTIAAFLLEQELVVYLVLFDRDAVQLGKQLSASLQQYIDDHYIQERSSRRIREEAHLQRLQLAEQAALAEDATPVGCSLEEAMQQLEETFSQRLLSLMAEKGMTASEVYKRANLDRKHFSKIRLDRNYQPKKTTVLALAVALRLNLSETKAFLQTAGFALTHSSKLDVIVEFFITQGCYDIFEINQALFKKDQHLLGL